MTSSDGQLLAHAQNHSHDDTAFTIFFFRYKTALMQHVISMVHDKELAEDLTLNAWNAFWQRIQDRTLDLGRNPKGLLFPPGQRDAVVLVYRKGLTVCPCGGKKNKILFNLLAAYCEIISRSLIYRQNEDTENEQVPWFEDGGRQRAPAAVRKRSSVHQGSPGSGAIMNWQNASIEQGRRSTSAVEGGLSVAARAEAVHIAGESLSPLAVGPARIDQLIGEIRRLWTQDTTRILDVAARMKQMRCSLERGAWSRLWRSRKLPFGKRKGERLTLIGQAIVTLNASDRTHLPSALSTLYCLARLGGARIKESIESGEIHSALGCQEARALLIRFKAAPLRPDKGSSLRRRVRRFCAFVDSTWDNLTHTDQQWVEASLRELLDRQTSTTTNPPHNTTLPGVTSS